jgi:hypothetical protein
MKACRLPFKIRLLLTALTLPAVLEGASPTAEHGASPAPTSAIEVALPTATPETAGTNVVPVEGRPPELDAAFDFAPDLGGARDFLLGHREDGKASGTEWQERIDMARKQREMGNHELAFANLQEVLDGSGDESFKKTALLEMASTH